MSNIYNIKKEKISYYLSILCMITIFNTDSIRVFGNLSIFYIILILYLFYELFSGKIFLKHINKYINIIGISSVGFIINILISDLFAKELNIFVIIGNIYPLIGTIIFLFLINEDNKKYFVDYSVYTNIFYISCQIHAIYGLLQAILFIFFGIRTNNVRGSILNLRVSGLFPDANIYSFSVLMALSFLLSKENKNSNIITIIFRKILIIINLIVIFLTGSRTAFIVAILIIILNFYFKIKNIKYKIMFIFFLLFLIIININNIINLIDYYTYNILGRNIDVESDIRISILWKTALEIFFKHPLIGAGTDAVMRQTGTLAHNMILALLSDRGIIGTLIYLFPLIYLFLKAKKGNKENILMVISYLLASMGISNWNLRIPIILLLFNIWELEINRK